MSFWAIEKSQGHKIQSPFKPPALKHEISRRFILKTLENQDED